VQGHPLQKREVQKNESNAWALIYDQCSLELKNKLKGTSGYDASKKDNDVVALVMMLRSYCCQFNTHNDEYMLIVGAIKNFLYFFQKTMQANVNYHEDFMAMVEVIEGCGGAGSLTYFPNMIKKVLESKKINMDKASAREMRDAKKKVHDKFLAALMLSGANREQYGESKRSMAENYVTGTSKYPESPEVVLCILSAYTLPPGWNRCLKQEGGAGDEGAMFVQSDGRDNSWKKNISCHNCGKKGHLKWGCPNKKTNKGGEQVHANIENDPDEEENIFVQAWAKGVVNKNFLLLDNQSTQDDDTRKVIEDKAKTEEPEQPSEQSSGMIRKSSRERVPTKRYEDYELYVTVAEEEEILLATNGDKSNDEDDGGVSNEGNHAEMDDEALSSVAHYIMVHCVEKKMLKKWKRKCKPKYKPKTGQYTLDAGLKKFRSRGEMAVTKELCQFNTYEVFEPLEASTLDEKEKKGVLSLLIFLKEKRNGDVKAQSCANRSVQRNHVIKE
jgi:hypothetical protein